LTSRDFSLLLGMMGVTGVTGVDANEPFQKRGPQA
jgi:hypothetical protein